jgi:hypothetical protein
MGLFNFSEHLGHFKAIKKENSWFWDTPPPPPHVWLKKTYLPFFI